MSQQSCESCGMPIDSGQYCQYCTDDAGNLQDFDTRFAAMTSWQQRSDPGASAEKVAADTLAYLATMPAWRDHPRVSGAGSTSW